MDAMDSGDTANVQGHPETAHVADTRAEVDAPTGTAEGTASADNTASANDTASAENTGDLDSAPAHRPSGGRRVLTRRQKVSAVVLSALVSLGVALIAAGVSGSVTGDEQSRLPEEIEQIQPALGDKVLNQANVLVDLIPGYTGRLILDDTPLATQSTAEAEPTGGASPPSTTIAIDPDSVRFDAGNNTLSFQPRPGAALERFSVGRHTVKLIYWKITESEASAYSYFWYFDVTA